MSFPPPLPDRDDDAGAVRNGAPPPPPLPGTRPAGEAYRAAAGRRKGILIAVLAVVASGVLMVVAIVAAALVFGLSAREFEVGDSIRACVVTAADAEEWFEMEVHPEFETWDTDRYIDRSVQLYYTYSDEADSTYISCNLTEEPKISDAVVSYRIEWGGLRLGNRIGPGGTIELEEKDDVFQWGDRSRFAFQVVDGERHGFAFVTRKGGKVFFLDCWGLLLETPEEISAFLLPHLEQLDAISLIEEASR